MPEHDLVQIFLTLQREFGARVHAVTDDQWDGPTPNAAWSVADLVAHLITEHLWVEPLLNGLELDAAADAVDRARSFVREDGVGASYIQAWDQTAEQAATAVSVPGALERTVSLSRGDTPASGYLREMIFDITVHAWDLGRAIGYPGALPADVVQAVWQESRKFGDLSASGMFDHPVAVPPDAPALDRLIAMTGRDPRWSDSVYDR
ncbi:TIGR03086 family metal-binding protein [uncultured Jatrophihabitans sp.]|uniref:TIGR03086 family metal-binding protein n=1 Tax=uncultured Jatrophihabitans sp. TaxID=1610747 RepID=UPI0035C9ECF5